MRLLAISENISKNVVSLGISRTIRQQLQVFGGNSLAQNIAKRATISRSAEASQMARGRNVEVPQARTLVQRFAVRLGARP